MYGKSGLTTFSNAQDIQEEHISGTNTSGENISKGDPLPRIGHPPGNDRPIEFGASPDLWIAELPHNTFSDNRAQVNGVGKPMDASNTDASDDVGDHRKKQNIIHQTTQTNSSERDRSEHIVNFPHIDPSPETVEIVSRAETASETAPIKKTPEKSEHIVNFPHIDPSPETVETVSRAETASETAPIKKTPEKTTFEKQILVRPGNTLLTILTAAGVRGEDANRAITVFEHMFDPKRIKPGNRIDLILETHGSPETGLALENNPDLRLRTATIQIEPLRSVVIEREGISFLASLSEQKVRREERRLSGIIFNSLSQAAYRENVPATVIDEMIDAYSYDVDFQRDIRREDRFEVMYEENFIGDQPVPGTAKLIHASLELSGQKSHLYRFRPAKGEDGFYNEQGQGVRKALLRTPVNGARLSSRYGMRKHPILGYNRMHRGVDFAAPKGTPIYAAGNGVVRKAHYNGDYGHYIEIKHNEKFSTAYAHLSRYAKGVKTGTYVRQGQIIGYVGSSGLSSGPHLHFEVRRNNKSINPLSMRLPSVEKLSGDDLRTFKERIADIQHRYANLEKKTAVVSRK